MNTPQRTLIVLGIAAGWTGAVGVVALVLGAPRMWPGLAACFVVMVLFGAWIFSGDIK